VFALCSSHPWATTSAPATFCDPASLPLLLPAADRGSLLARPSPPHPPLLRPVALPPQVPGAGAAGSRPCLPESPAGESSERRDDFLELTTLLLIGGMQEQERRWRDHGGETVGMRDG
jgi:hypothetical protein